MSQKLGWCIHRVTADQLPQIISLSIQADGITTGESWQSNTNYKLTYKVFLFYFWRGSLEKSSSENCLPSFFSMKVENIYLVPSHIKSCLENLFITSINTFDRPQRKWQQTCGENCNKRHRRCDKYQLLKSHKSNCNIYQEVKVVNVRLDTGSIYFSHWSSI